MCPKHLNISITIVGCLKHVYSTFPLYQRRDVVGGILMPAMNSRDMILLFRQFEETL
jgi:hypothetical protein